MKIVSVAKTKYIRMSPGKIQQVVDTIRGKTYNQALIILDKSKKIAAGPVWQTLYSAAANAKYLNNVEKENLIVKEIFVNQAGILKRIRPRQKGKIFKIEKKVSHITVKLYIQN
jgi:large subunit ribosomal protein L22